MERLGREKSITDRFATNAENMLSEWQKMPNSFITDEHSDQEFEAKRKNKFRINYFQKLGEYLSGIIKSLPSNREILDKELGKIFSDVRKYRQETGLVLEELIDRMDSFARKVLEKYRQIGV